MTVSTTEHQGSALVLDAQQQFWTEHQLAGLRQIGIDGASKGDLAVFMHVCQRTGLDPFARQIHMIERKGKQTIQTGIDGYRLIARRSVDRTGEKLAFGPVEWCDAEGHWSEVWLGDGNPAAARVTVYRGGEPYPAIALWREYVQYTRDGAITQMWATRGAGQLAKCAEALALRKAFPQDLSGIYVDEELQQADSVRGEVVERPAGGLAAALDAQAPPQDSGPGASQDLGRDDSVAAGDVGTPGPDPDPDGAVPAEVVEPMMSDAQRRNIGRLMGEKDGLGITDRDEALGYVSSKIGRTIASRNELTRPEAVALINALEADLALAKGADQ